MIDVAGGGQSSQEKLILSTRKIRKEKEKGRNNSGTLIRKISICFVNQILTRFFLKIIRPPVGAPKSSGFLPGS